VISAHYPTGGSSVSQAGSVANSASTTEQEAVTVDVRVEHPLVRAGLRAALQPHPDIMLVNETGDGRLRRPAGPVRADVTVVEVDSRHLAGPAPAGPVRAGGDVLARSFVAVASLHAEAPMLSAIRAGVRGFVSENAADQELPEAVRAIASGGAFMSPDCAICLFDWLADQLPGDLSRLRLAGEVLSERERDVLRLLGRGDSNAGIARRLVISETTVRSHVYHILTKLNLRTRTEAVLLGYQFRMAAHDRQRPAPPAPPGGQKRSTFR